MIVFHYSDKSTAEFDRLYSECDILLTTGDLTLFDFGRLRDLANRKPAFGVYGNHCSGNYFTELGIQNLHSKIIEFQGLKLGGFQSCLKYKDSGLFFTEEEAQKFADTFPYVDILLLHAGPKGMLDDPSDQVHVGSENIKRYVLEKQPKYVFCGHQYSDAEMEVGNTKIFRTYGVRLIEI